MAAVRWTGSAVGLALVSVALGDAGQLRAQGMADSAAAPPARRPPDANLDALDLSYPTAGLSFGSQALNLPQSGLSLPPGFGVALAGAVAARTGASTAPPRPAAAPPAGYPAASGAAAPAVTGGEAPVALAAVPVDAPPPAARPPGASLNAVALAFSSAALSFGTTATSLGSAAANVGGSAADLAGGSVTDLPGMSVREEGGGYRFTLGADVLFDFDRYNLRAEAGPILRKLVEQVAAEVPSARWQVEGHTDAKGSDAYNDQLSNRRAISVRRWLAEQGGVPGYTISTVGHGEHRPVAPNTHADGSDDPEGRQLNRRVEILVTPP